MAKGFSLIEVMVACALFSLTLGFCWQTYSTETKWLRVAINQFVMTQFVNNAESLILLGKPEALANIWSDNIKSTLPRGLGSIACKQRSCEIEVSWWETHKRKKTTLALAHV